VLEANSRRAIRAIRGDVLGSDNRIVLSERANATATSEDRLRAFERHGRSGVVHVLQALLTPPGLPLMDIVRIKPGGYRLALRRYS
jgi:hypothetical protein